MLGWRNIFSAYGAGVIKTFPALVKKQSFLEQWLNLLNKFVFADIPVLYELDERHLPAVAKCSSHKPDPGAGLAFALTGVNYDHRLFRLIVLKRHRPIYYYTTERFVIFRFSNILVLRYN